DEFVDAPAGRFDRPPHRSKIAVEDKDHIKWEAPLREGGEATNVGKQDRDLALASLGEIDPAPAVCGNGERRQQRRHLDLTARPQLAGEPDIGCRANAAQHPQLALRRAVDAANFPAYPDPASRAPAAAAADMGMRDAGEAARFEDAGPGHDIDE